MSSIAMGTISWVSRCPLCTLQLCCNLISSCHQDFAAIILGEEVGVNIENNIENSVNGVELPSQTRLARNRDRKEAAHRESLPINSKGSVAIQRHVPTAAQKSANQPCISRTQGKADATAKAPQSKDAVVNTVIARLATELKPHKGVLLSLLERLDRKRIGYLSGSDVQRVLKNLNCRIGGSELETLIQAFDANGKGAICYCDFVQAIQAHALTAAQKTEIVRPWWEDDEYIVSVLDRLKTALRPRAADLLGRLQNTDKRRAGVLKPLELHSLLVHSFGIQVHEGDLGVLWKVFDQDRNGQINYMALLDVIRFHEAHVKAVAQPMRSTTPEAPDLTEEWWMSDKVLCMVLERISTQLRGNNAALFQMLVKLDKNKNGLISPTEMHKGLITLGIKLHEGDLGSIIRIFDRNSKNEIDYMELYRVLVQLRARGSAARTVAAPTLAPQAADDQRTLETVLERILKEMNGKHSGVVQILRHLDHDSSGSITDRELAHGMLTLNVRLSKAEVKAVVAAFDTNGNGKVDLKELAKALDRYRLNGTVPQSASQQRRATQAALESLAHKLAVHKLSAQVKVLKKLDAKKTGLLGPQELRRGLEQLGVSLSDREFSVIALHFDPTSKGCIDYAEFCRAITSVVASITEPSPAAQEWTKEKEDVVRRIFDSLVALMAERHETILRMLRRLDHNENGLLSDIELQHGLGTLGIRLTADEVALLVRVFDRDGSANVDYTELHKAVTRYRATNVVLMPTSSPQKAAKPKMVDVCAIMEHIALTLPVCPFLLSYVHE